MFRLLYILPFLVVSISLPLESLGQLEDHNGTRTSYIETAEAFFPSLSAILKKVEGRAPLLLEEQEKVNEATANRLVADSARGLQVSVGLNGHSLYENRPNTDYYQQYRFLASAYLRKPLYHWGALRAGSRIAELAEESSSASYGNLLKTLSDQIRSDYLGLVLSTYGIRLAERSLKLAIGNAEGMAERLRLGLVTELSLSEAKTSVLQQRINLAELERKRKQDTLTFRNDTGFDGNLSLSMSNRFIEFSENHEFAKNLPISTGSVYSLGIESMENLIAMENNRIVVAKSGLRPKVNLLGGFYQDRVDLQDSRSSIERNNFIIGLEANWSVWDSSRSRGQKRSALARKRRYEMQLEREIRNFRMETENQREHLVTLGEIINSGRKLVDAAEDRFGKSQIEFDRNRITAEIFFSYRLAMDKSRLLLLGSVVNYLNVRSLYMRLLGVNSK